MIPVYSIAKPFLAQAVIELGLPLETFIGDYLLDLAPVYGKRRIDQLLNHTSGLGSYGELPDYESSVDAGLPAWPTDVLLSKCVTIAHDKSGFSYSNLGYLLLAMLVEHETALPYFDALEQLVFKPIGAAEFSPWIEIHNAVPGYDPGWVYSRTFLSPPDAIAPALAKLVEHRASTLGLRPGLVPVDVEDTGFVNPAYTYGFMVDAGLGDTDPLFVGHGGSGPGFDLMALVNTETWQSALEYTTQGFEQSEAIERLCTALGS
jgi:D-alanyl-D-alanine carboxypeptidase